MIEIKYTFSELGIPLYVPSTCVAIVGSSAALKSGFGNSIDKHEYIVRFNRAPVDGYESMVGSREDLRVTNNHVFNNNKLDSSLWPEQPKNFIKNLRKKRILYMAEDLGPWNEREKNTHKSCQLFLAAYFQMPRIKEELGIKLRKPMSVGLYTTCLFLVSGIKPTLYGFSVEGSSPRDHYWEDRPSAGSYHDVGEEKRVLKDLRDRGMVIIK